MDQVFGVKVIPHARQASVVVEPGGNLKVRATVPAEKGKANQSVCRLLAEHFQVPPSQISILRGSTSSHKLVRVQSSK